MLSSCTLWNNTAAPKTGAGAGGGSRAHGPSLSGLCISTLLRTGCNYTPSQSRGQAWAVLKPGRQFCSPSCSPRQQKSGSTALALPHLPSCTQPDSCSCTRAPCQDTAQPPQIPVKPGTAQKRHLHLGSCLVRSQKSLPWLHVYPRFSLHTLPLPSFLQHPQHPASTPGLGTAAHTPLNPAHCRMVRSPSKQLLQPHLLLSAHGKDTPGTGKTLWGPGECCSAGGCQPSREKLKCPFWVMGINNHWVKSCATHRSLLNLTSSPHYCGS